ncbi:MAG: hypothetical protein GY749_25270 [Desulfobacteraceae bacterium]|nr:hypothetical protein [Desulfobacteraceae bacterium]
MTKRTVFILRILVYLWIIHIFFYCPYYTDSGGDAFILELNQNTDVEGFYFLGELYIRQE